MAATKQNRSKKRSTTRSSSASTRTRKASTGRRYSKKAGDKVEETMHEKKRGTLRSGSGKKVTSRKQAIAIGLSKARKAGAKVPKKKRSA
jgi:hypothetical protein